MNEIQAPLNVYDVVDLQQEKFASVLSTDKINWNKESQFAIQALQKNDFLNETAWKNQPSLQNAIINVASIGISLNPALKHAYLVPRDKMVCLDISFMGLMSIAQKSGSIVWGQAKLVYKNDVYKNTGVDTAPSHEQETFGEKGDVVGVYCTVKLPSGDYLTEEMDIEVLNKIKNTSKAKKGPWATWPEEMMRKSVVKRASKYWPQSDRVSHAVDMLNQQEGNIEEIQQTSPEIAEPSQDQKAYYDGLISNSDKLGMYVFLTTIDESIKNNLYHSFKHGEKGRYQKISDGLYKEGFAVFTACLSAIEANLGGDDSAVLEITETMDGDTIKLIKDRLNPEMVMEFNRLNN